MLARTFGCVRVAYNSAMQTKESAYRDGVKLNYNKLSAALTQSKRTPELAFLNDVSCVPLQQALRHLDQAYQSFFQRRCKHPRFKSRRDRQSAEFTASAFTYRPGQLSLAKIGRLKVKWSRALESDPTTVTITKDSSGRYFVTLTMEEEKQKLPLTGQSIGVDLGIATLAALSDGTKVENPRHLNRHTRALKRAQQVMSRRVKGSGRRNRARLRVAKRHAQVAAARKDYLNKITTDLVRRFDVIAIEDLNVSGMLKNHCLARAIADVGFGEFRRQLEYKCLWYGRELRLAGRFQPTSQVCSKCGVRHGKLPLSVRTWTCLACGAVHDRDTNAAINILAVGQTVTARGADVKPKVTLVTRRNLLRSVNRPALAQT